MMFFGYVAFVLFNIYDVCVICTEFVKHFGIIMYVPFGLLAALVFLQIVNIICSAVSFRYLYKNVKIKKGVSIKNISSKDVQWVNNIYKHSAKTIYHNILPSSFSKYKQMFTSPDMRVLSVNNSPVGFCVSDDKKGQCYGIFVEPRLQRKGYGSLLLKDFEKIAKYRRNKKVLFVDKIVRKHTMEFMKKNQWSIEVNGDEFLAKKNF